MSETNKAGEPRTSIFDDVLTLIGYTTLSEKRRRMKAESSDEATLRLLKCLRQTDPVVRTINELESTRRIR